VRERDHRPGGAVDAAVGVVSDDPDDDLRVEAAAEPVDVDQVAGGLVPQPEGLADGLGVVGGAGDASGVLAGGGVEDVIGDAVSDDDDVGVAEPVREGPVEAHLRCGAGDVVPGGEHGLAVLAGGPAVELADLVDGVDEQMAGIVGFGVAGFVSSRYVEHTQRVPPRSARGPRGGGSGWGSPP